MELEETVASIFYIFIFAAFLTITIAQQSWFQTTISGFDTLNEYQIDLINDFTHSPCFIAKNNQGNDLLGIFDATLLNKKTEEKLLSTISEKLIGSNYIVHYASKIDDCINTGDNYYYYEVWEQTTPNARWIFGNSTIQGYKFGDTWTEGQKPISIKRGDNISIGIIKYGFSKNPAENGIAISSSITANSITNACTSAGGIICNIGETCTGINAASYDIMDSTFIGTLPILGLTTTNTNKLVVLCCYNGGTCTP